MGANETVVRRGIMDGPADYAIAALVLAVAIVMAGTWTVGQLAGLLFKFAWPHVSIGVSLSIAVRLPRHLANPRLAWPEAARGQLPGLAGFLVAALIVLTAALAVGWVVLRRLGSGRAHRGFAARRHLNSALSHEAVIARGTTVRPSLAGTKFTVEDVGVRLGWTARGGVPLAITAESSVLLLAAPRQGKTSQVVIPGCTAGRAQRWLLRSAPMCCWPPPPCAKPAAGRSR